eukprot:scaffold808_cov196-Alexandrium_tamarense.AAC.66
MSAWGSVVRYVQINPNDVDTELLQDATRKENSPVTDGKVLGFDTQQSSGGTAQEPGGVAVEFKSLVVLLPLYHLLPAIISKQALSTGLDVVFSQHSKVVSGAVVLQTRNANTSNVCTQQSATLPKKDSPKAMGCTTIGTKNDNCAVIWYLSWGDDSRGVLGGIFVVPGKCTAAMIRADSTSKAHHLKKYKMHARRRAMIWFWCEGGQGERGCQQCKLIVQFIDHFDTNIIEKGEILDSKYDPLLLLRRLLRPTSRQEGARASARNLGDNVFTANPTINLHQQCTFAINTCIGDDRKERVREDITTVEFAHIADGDAITEVVYASCSSSSTSNIMPKLNTTYFFSLDNIPYCWSPQSIEVEDSILSNRICCAWVTIVAGLAAREGSSRSNYSYDGQLSDCFIAILGGVGLTLLHLVTCILRLPFNNNKQTHFNAQVIIPIAGMLFGNALSATSLGLSRLLSGYLDNGRDSVELRLSRGANVWEASLPVIREATEAALLPTVNAMASVVRVRCDVSVCIIVLVSTNLTFYYTPRASSFFQILGGQPPSSAASYQVMIYFAICASSCLTAIGLASIVTARMFDLKKQALVPQKEIPGFRRANTDDDVNGKKNNPTKETPDSQAQPPSTDRANTTMEEEERYLTIRCLTVENTNLTIHNLELNKGDRLGIIGRSGVGKTQLLRTIARIDPSLKSESTEAVLLKGQSWTVMPPTTWRSKVMWVSQDRTTLSGTPQEFYSQIMGYRSHKSHHLVASDPVKIATQWNLPETAWDRNWNALSGGEAQRASLAIALSLGPCILLLDEPTSSCDIETTTKIERTLKEMGATVLIVSHSNEQVKRFCTDTVVLS